MESRWRRARKGTTLFIANCISLHCAVLFLIAKCLVEQLLLKFIFVIKSLCEITVLLTVA